MSCVLIEMLYQHLITLWTGNNVLKCVQARVWSSLCLFVYSDDKKQNYELELQLHDESKN